MRLSEAIRVAEKAKAWLDRFPEYRAAIEALIEVARTRDPQAEVPASPKSEPSTMSRVLGEFRKSWDEFAGDMLGFPPCEDDPAPAQTPVHEPVEIVDADGVRALPASSIYVACSSTGVPERSPRIRQSHVEPSPIPDPIPADWVYYRVLYRAPVSKPAAPQAGDPVDDGDAARALPTDTLIKGSDGAYGAVKDGRVAWTSPSNPRRWPAKIIAVGGECDGPA